MKKIMMLVTLAIMLIVGGTFKASELTSTNTVAVDLTGWEEPEPKPPKKPVPPKGSEDIKPPAGSQDPKQPGNSGSNYSGNKRLPQTGATSQNLIYIGSIMVLIAFMAFKYNKQSKQKGEL